MNSIPQPTCKCGCGEPVPPWHYYVEGHQGAERRKWITVRINAESGCWKLPNKPEKNGYVRIGTRKNRVGAHRMFYEMFRGSIDEGAHIHHLCGNRWCVNPQHLEVLSPLEHAHRKAGSKISSELAATIRREYAKRGVTQLALAQRYGVNQSAISRIVRGQSWQI